MSDSPVLELTRVLSALAEVSPPKPDLQLTEASLNGGRVSAGQARSAVETGVRLSWYRRRSAPALVAAAAFVLVAAIAIPLLLLDTDESVPPADQPLVTTVAPTAAPQPPLPGDEPPVTTVPATTVTPPPSTAPPEEPGIDYGAVAEEVGRSETPLGPITWLESTRVPVPWYEAGFPKASPTYGYDFLSLHGERTIDAALYEVPGGYLGLGAGEDTRSLIVDMPGTSNNTWLANVYSWVFVTEVWFSGDGEAWELKAEDPFGSGAAIMHDPLAIAHRDGRWVLIGWLDVPEKEQYFDEVVGARAAVPASAPPAVWVSDDLRTWTQVDFDFDVEGMQTNLTSIVASERGWVIGGVRVSTESPLYGEWAMWASADGLTWETVAIDEAFGELDCRPDPQRPCHRLRLEMTDDAVVAYGWRFTPGDLPFGQAELRWTLWIGTFESALPED